MTNTTRSKSLQLVESLLSESHALKSIVEKAKGAFLHEISNHAADAELSPKELREVYALSNSVVTMCDKFSMKNARKAAKASEPEVEAEEEVEDKPKSWVNKGLEAAYEKKKATGEISGNSEEAKKSRLNPFLRKLDGRWPKNSAFKPSQLNKD